MGERKGHYLAAATKPRLPGSMFTLTVTPLLRGDGTQPNTTYSRFGRAHITYSRRYQDRWTSPEVVSCSTAKGAIQWMEERASAHRTNWVVAPIATDAMTLLNWWNYAESQGIQWDQVKLTSPLNTSSRRTDTPVTFSRFVARGTPDIIRYSHRDVVWQWVSGLQYLPDGAEAMGKADPDVTEYTRQAGTRALIKQEWSTTEAMQWHRAMVRFMAWWSAHALAPWGATIGQLAIGMLRTHAPKKTLCTHSVPEIHALERAASFGGRATCWYVGSVGNGINGPEVHTDKDGEQTLRQVTGPVTHIDVSSMYPSILRDMAFPVKLRFLEQEINPAKIVELCNSWGAIAKVTINTPIAEFPRRDGDVITYPVGRFTTVLAGPELLRAAQLADIERVHVAAVYNLARPFQTVAETLIRLRAAASRADYATTALPAKLLANSLGGKLAQRTGGWERCPKMDEPGRWGMLHTVHAQTGARERYRYLAGLCWQWAPDKTGSGPFTAAFAYLTAYGRMMMADIRRVCPARSVVSQDTDGLWVLPAALDAIRAAGMLDAQAAGKLRVVGSATNARWYGPRHYCTDGEWTLAGFSSAVVDSDNRTIWDSVKSSLWARHTPGAPDETVTTIRRSVIKPDLSGASLDRDGWTIPLRASRAKDAVDDASW